MFSSLWLRQLHRHLFGRQSKSSQTKVFSAKVRRRVRLDLESLEDRLVPSADAVQTAAVNISTPFSESQQTVQLTANVTDSTTPATTVNEGTVTFIVDDSTGTQVGTQVQGTVINGTANANFVLPSEPAGTYTIKVSYSDSANNFTDGGDTSGSLKVTAAATTTSASSVTAPFSTSDQNVTLTATVTSAASPVNEGSVSFSLFDFNGNLIGTTTPSAVNNGQASAVFVLPGGTPTGNYVLLAGYSDSSGNFATSSDNSQFLTVISSTSTNTSLSLNTGSIVPNLSNQTAQVTLTAQVNNPSGVVNEGVVSFTLAGVTAQGNVSNGTASVQLTVPLQAVTQTAVVQLAYDDSATDNFADSNASTLLTGNIWSGLLPSNLTFAADIGALIHMQVGGQSLFGYVYSPAGMLTQINVDSLILPVKYTDVSGGVLVTIAGLPWQMNFINSNGQSEGIATLSLAPDGSAEWLLVDPNGHVLGTLPS